MIILPKDSEKKVEIWLRGLEGIGKNKSRKICQDLGITRKTSIRDLTPRIEDLLLKKIYDTQHIEYKQDMFLDTKRVQVENILSLIKLGTYRGSRHFYGYPIKGRTISNSKTARRLNARIRKYL